MRDAWGWVPFCGLLWGFLVWSAFPAGGNFLFWQKRKSPKKVALGRERIRAERSDGPLLRSALGTWISGWLAMSEACWFYRSFANSFTLCLIGSFVLQAFLADACPVFFLVRAGRGLIADSEKCNGGSTPDSCERKK
jgi:hypothetical protein